ncbi:glycosyltransferase family 2 protein, partial [Faecalibacillus faecis]
MKVSIIVPYEGYYNYLQDCLESIQDQKNVELETLLVGNQKTDDFKKLVEMYKDTISLQVINCPIEEGVAKKRNLGLDKATGDYIYFLDSDDYIMPNTLSSLLEKALKEDLDLTVGKRWVTWFKKQVFETMGPEKNEELNLKDKDDDRNHKFLEKDYTDIENPNEQRRIDLLIRAKKGIRNITVLNILIKRNVIEEHHLRFNEDFIYYSDLPFVEGLVMYGNKIAFDEETLYAKRKHNDPINTPALSQIKDETKFDEFINVYKYAISLVDKESRIRYYLDSKMIKYYSNYFAKKIRRSKNDFWRDERFNQMALLMKDVRDDLLKNMSRYQQKLVKLSRNHDLSGTQKVIAKHLAKSKLKKMLKNKNEVNKYLYRHRYLEEPIEE